MTARAFFQRVQQAESELKILNAKLAHFEDLGLSIGGAPSGSTGNRHNSASRVELAACGTVDALRAVLDQQRAFLAIIGRAERVISLIPQERYRKILTYHYLCGKSLKWISDELEYNDPNSVYRAHGWALSEAQKVLNREGKGNDCDS